MSPAELTSAFLVVAVVGRVVVTGDDAGKAVTEELAEHCDEKTCCDESKARLQDEQ